MTDTSPSPERFVPECCGMDVADPDEVEHGAAYVRSRDYDALSAVVASQAAEMAALRSAKEKAEAEQDAVNRLINTPSTKDFLASVELEVAHQVQRWPSVQDAGKSDADWFWLIGYLAGKAIRPEQALEKRLHHIITTAAVCLNWHRHITGEITSMRPGIEPPRAAISTPATKKERNEDL